MLPWTHPIHSPIIISIGSAVYAQFTADSPYALQWAAPSCKNASCHGVSGPHLTYDSLGPFEPATQMASRSVQPLLHRRPWRLSLYTLQLGRPFHPKIAPSCWGWTPSNVWFPGPTRVLNPKGISIGSALFAGLTSVTDIPTDHATRSVTVGRIYVCIMQYCDAA